jgi:hypothetical protein
VWRGKIMSQSTSYKILSQTDPRYEEENANISLSETSDQLTSLSSSQDSLDIVLVEIGNKRPKRKVRRKRRRKIMGGGIHSFEGAESYEVSELQTRDVCEIT